MSHKLTKRQLKGLEKSLTRNYLEEKERRRRKREEKAKRRSRQRHKSKKQEIEELVDNDLAAELDDDR
jgi:hypothetical protein